MAYSTGEITIRNANIPGGPWRNFEGRAGKYNVEGVRSFTVFLDEEKGRELAADGWNVKLRQGRDDTDEPQAYLSVSVSFKVRPPTVVFITSRGRRTLTEEELIFLDWCEFEKVDLIIRPYEWTVRDQSGIKAYLKSIYVTMYEDELAKEYAAIPEDRGTLAIESGVPEEEIRDYIEGEIVEEDFPRAIGSGR